MKIQIFHLVKSNRFSPGNYVMERLRDFSLSDLDLRFIVNFCSCLFVFYSVYIIIINRKLTENLIQVYFA